MYTVLLVDDEESVLSVLKASISWQELGVDVLLTASDGREALELFEQRDIDLLVTDIRMPVMDGIELIRRVRILQPETHCVLLTAYGEFELAQEAIRLGVDNYLLKPVAREEVVQTIESTLDNIYKNRRSSESLLKENTMRRWALGTISAEELGERAAVLGINLYQQAFCVLCMVRRNQASIAAFRAACKNFLQQKGQAYGFWDEKGRYILILCGKQFNRETLEEDLLELARREEAQDKVSMAIGTVVGSYEMLHISYQAASDTLETADFSTAGVIVPLAPETMGFDADLLSEELRLLFYEADHKVKKAGTLHLAEKIYRGNWDETIFSSLCRACVHVLTQDFPLNQTLTEQIYAEAEKIVRPHTAEEGKTAAVELLEIVQKIFDACFAQYSPMVQHMILYIRNSVLKGEEISLKVFCARHGVTPAYLGHMMKKETGIFFNEYLLHCRLDRSMILLRNPNYRIKDIAEIVGFSSTSYYVKCFREYKGTSPAKYRLAWGGKQQGGSD